MDEARCLRKTIYTTGRQSHVCLGFPYKRVSQTFTLGLPVMGVASFIFPHSREHPRDVQPLHLLSIFPSGQPKLSLAPRHLRGGGRGGCPKLMCCFRKVQSTSSSERAESFPPPLPCGENPQLFPHYIISLEVSFSYMCGTSLFRPFLTIKTPFLI